MNVIGPSPRPNQIIEKGNQAKGDICRTKFIEVIRKLKRILK